MGARAPWPAAMRVLAPGLSLTRCRPSPGWIAPVRALHESSAILGSRNSRMKPRIYGWKRAHVKVVA